MAVNAASQSGRHNLMHRLRVQQHTYHGLMMKRYSMDALSLHFQPEGAVGGKEWMKKEMVHFYRVCDVVIYTVQIAIALVYKGVMLICLILFIYKVINRI